MSKIPEGATHTYTVRGKTTYRRLNRGSWEAYSDGDWVWIMAPHHDDYVMIPAEPEWTGEGLPPVGIACEWHPNQNGWIQVEILGHHGEETWFRRQGHESSETCLRMAFFRPIRTPEQIAAEKRDAAIKEMQRLVGSCNTFPFAELYDYGYRLQVAE